MYQTHEKTDFHENRDSEKDTEVIESHAVHTRADRAIGLINRIIMTMKILID